MLGDADLARDAAQEATVRALLSLGSLRDDRRFGAWFIGIGLNVCRSWLTGTERRVVPREPGTAELAGVTTGDDHTFDLVVARELGSRVRAAVGELPTGQREAVIRFYLLGLTQAEVAAELNTGSGAVKTRLNKARKTLRETLKDTHEETINMSDQMLHQPNDHNDLVPVRVTGLRRTAPGDAGVERHIVFLEGPKGERLPIWIGPSEATAMALILEGIELPRPGAHQLTASLVAGAGRRIAEVRLTDLTVSVFIAQVVLDDRTTVDARPSDAITLALLTDTPITVRSSVLAESERRVTKGGDLVTEAEDAVDDQGKIAAEALATLFSDLRETDPQLEGMTATDKLAYYKAALDGERRD